MNISFSFLDSDYLRDPGEMDGQPHFSGVFLPVNQTCYVEFIISSTSKVIIAIISVQNQLHLVYSLVIFVFFISLIKYLNLSVSLFLGLHICCLQDCSNQSVNWVNQFVDRQFFQFYVIINEIPWIVDKKRKLI